jgi:hypothetical protein
MSPFLRPGWAQPNGHIVRSHMEAALCDYLSAAVEPHVHRGLNFEAPIGQNQYALYVPSIVLTQTKKDGRTILIEPIDSARPGGGVRRLRGFRQEHGRDYYLVVIARRVLRARLPDDTYDLLLPLEDFSPLDQFLRGL